VVLTTRSSETRGWAGNSWQNSGIDRLNLHAAVLQRGGKLQQVALVRDRDECSLHFDEVGHD
jgi:hypothetical protein